MPISGCLYGNDTTTDVLLPSVASMQDMILNFSEPIYQRLDCNFDPARFTTIINVNAINMLRSHNSVFLAITLNLFIH